MRLVTKTYKTLDSSFEDELNEKPAQKRIFVPALTSQVPDPIIIPAPPIFISHQSIDNTVQQIIQNAAARIEAIEVERKANKLKNYLLNIKSFLDATGERLTLFEKRVMLLCSYTYDGVATLVQFIYAGSLMFFTKIDLALYISNRIVHLAWFCNFTLALIFCFNFKTIYIPFLFLQFLRICVLIGSPNINEIKELQRYEEMNQEPYDDREPEQVGDFTFVVPKNSRPRE